jgi:hypothetical protein
MKTLRILTLIFGVAVLPLTRVPAQDAGDQLTIPLSNPGKAGSLRVSLINGSLTVRGHNAKDVMVSYSGSGRTPRRENPDGQGLRRIPNNNMGLEVREENNNVRVSTSAIVQDVNLDIRVPRNFSLKLSLVNGGNLTVEEVEGEFELSNVNGSITLKDVSGSVVANSVNGNVVASFRTVTPDAPMAFSSLNGKIDVTFPNNVKMLAKMKSDQGEIFSDFDMAFDKTAESPKVTKTSSGSRVYLDNWTYGKINGGGPEVLFKNFNGNIYIRKAKK